MKAKRARLTKAERAALLAQQGGLCVVWGCTESRNLIEEHSTPHVWTGAKADQLMCAKHHHEKTFGKRHLNDGDVSKIAKANRHRNGKTQADKRKVRGSLIRGKSKIESAGFQGHRKFDGTVVRRDR